MVLFAALLLLQGCASSLVPGQSSALWTLVDAHCNQGWMPMPLLQCIPDRGEVLMKDRCGPTRYLLIPTVRRTGVESAELLRDDEPNYFADAWAERGHVVEAAGRASAGTDELGLAINSRWGRSQDQLHIHIDFVQGPVREAIRQWAAEGAVRPTIEVFGHEYRIVHLAALDRPTVFQLAAAGEDSPQQRERNTIALVGDGSAGFYALFGHADLASLDRGHGEEILVPKRCGD
jgi:CDP-diacylglycerol pyrophosphatase